MATLSFDGAVNIAVRLVTEHYPAAFLWEADGTCSKGVTTQATGIDHLRVVFSDGHNNTVIIESAVWGEFGAPVFHKGPWLEDLPIAWPVKMDLPEAVGLVAKAGLLRPFSTVTLRHPLYPGDTQPYFIFGMPGAGWVFVGTRDKSVKPYRGGELADAAGAAQPFMPLETYVGECLAAARKTHPEAQVLSASATLFAGVPGGISSYEATIDNRDGTATVDSVSVWGLRTSKVERRPLGIADIAWPVKVTLEKAIALAAEHGVKAVGGVTLSQPIHPDVVEPSYVLHAQPPSLEAAWVGANSGKVKIIA
jgi:hypothetical protein